MRTCSPGPSPDPNSLDPARPGGAHSVPLKRGRPLDRAIGLGHWSRHRVEPCGQATSISRLPFFHRHACRLHTFVRSGNEEVAMPAVSLTVNGKAVNAKVD